jgi:ribosomal protein S12 methylthiotransferase
MSILHVIKEEGGCSTKPVSLNVIGDQERIDAQKFTGRAAVITLGCAKNQVDSEVMIGVLKNYGYELVDDIASADVALINTCGFLQSAVQESINCILDVSEYKKSGSLRNLIVAGCAVERYREELQRSLPEVDCFITLEDILKVGDAASGTQSEQFATLLTRAGRPYFIYDESMPRVLATKNHTAYVKVSEGCNRPCTFCIIPKIRGEMRSRSIASITKEVQELAQQGVKEVNLVAQDLTSYGKDRDGGETLHALLASLDTTGISWVRLLYAYPIGVTEELLSAMVNLPHILEYLDIPLQHSSEKLLKEMKRPIGKYAPRTVVQFIREKAPEIKIRTTFIVGFPGETEADVDDLVSFVQEGHFSSVGVFTYSPEEGTPSATMENQVSERDKKKRRERVMKAQQKVVMRDLESLIGTTLEVLVEGSHEDTDLIITGRTRFQAPEVDGQVLINDSEGGEDLAQAVVGTICHVRITEVAGYDLVGTLVQE